MDIINSLKYLKNNYVQDQTSSNKDPKLLKAVKDFESILIYNMLKSMRQTISKSGLTEDAPGKSFFEGMFDQKVANIMASQQNNSLSEILYDQLSGTKSKIPQNNIPNIAVKKAYSSNNIYNRIEKYNSIVEKASQTFNIDKELIASVIAQESGGRPDVISSKGAKGLMQLMDETAKDMGVNNSMDPVENIMAGSKYLSYLLKRYDGNLKLTLAGYNAGPTAVDKYKGIPPYPETKNYVEKVLAFYEKFKHN